MNQLQSLFFYYRQQHKRVFRPSIQSMFPRCESALAVPEDKVWHQDPNFQKFRYRCIFQSPRLTSRHPKLIKYSPYTIATKKIIKE